MTVGPRTTAADSFLLSSFSGMARIEFTCCARHTLAGGNGFMLSMHRRCTGYVVGFNGNLCAVICRHAQQRHYTTHKNDLLASTHLHECHAKKYNLLPPSPFCCAIVPPLCIRTRKSQTNPANFARCKTTMRRRQRRRRRRRRLS